MEIKHARIILDKCVVTEHVDRDTDCVEVRWTRDGKELGIGYFSISSLDECEVLVKFLGNDHLFGWDDSMELYHCGERKLPFNLYEETPPCEW